MVTGVHIVSETHRSRLQLAAPELLRRLTRWRTRLRLCNGGVPRYGTDPSFLHQVEAPGCPICNSVANHDPRFFFWFFSETYRTIEELIRFTDGLGFCRWHAQRLVTHAGGHSQLRFVHAFAAARVQRLLAEEVNEPFRSPGRCIACDARDRAMRRSASFMSGLLIDPRHRHRYRSPSALCFPHLRWILANATAPIFEQLAEHHISLLTAALETLMNDAKRVSRDAMRHAVVLAVGDNPDLADPPDFAEASATHEPEPPSDPIARMSREIGFRGSCPICREVARVWTRSMAATNRAACDRSPVDDLVPTCAEHVWIAFNRGSEELAFSTTRVALRTALSQLRVALDRLRQPTRTGCAAIGRWIGDDRGTRGKHLQIAREVLAYPDRCPVCVRLKEAEDQSLDLLFRLLAKSHYRNRYERGYGLCLGHYSRGLRLVPEAPIRDFLTKGLRADLALLEWELEESARGAAWQARFEDTDEGECVAAKALQRFSGLIRLQDGVTGSGTASRRMTASLTPREPLACSFC